MKLKRFPNMFVDVSKLIIVPFLGIVLCLVIPTNSKRTTTPKDFHLQNQGRTSNTTHTPIMQNAFSMPQDSVLSTEPINSNIDNEQTVFVHHHRKNPKKKGKRRKNKKKGKKKKKNRNQARNETLNASDEKTYKSETKHGSTEIINTNKTTNQTVTSNPKQKVTLIPSKSQINKEKEQPKTIERGRTIGSGLGNKYHGGYSWQLPREWMKEGYPNPRKHPDTCGIVTDDLPHFCDPNQILTKHQVGKVQEIISKICLTTECPCDNCNSTMVSASTPCKGTKVGVAIVPIIGMTKRRDRDGEIKDKDVLHWADHLRSRTWRLGSTKCDEDILLLLVTERKKVYVSVGTAHKGIVTEDCKKAVAEDAQGLLAQGHYGKALQQMLEDYRFVIQGEFKCKINVGHVMPTGTVIAIVFTATCTPLMLCVILVFLGKGPFKGLGRGSRSHRSNKAIYKHNSEVWE